MENVFLDFPPLPRALEQISSLNEEQFAILKEAIIGVAGLDTSFARCKAIRTQLAGKLNSFDVYNILRSLIFLGNRYELGESSETTESELREFFEFIGLDKFVPDKQADQIYARVGKLLTSRRESSDILERQWQLETAIVDAAQDFDWSVELRPRFSEDGSQVDEFLPVVLFRVLVSNDRGDDKSYVFQMTQDGVNELENTLEAVNDQLMLLERSARLVSATPVLENA